MKAHRQTHTVPPLRMSRKRALDPQAASAAPADTDGGAGEASAATTSSATDGGAQEHEDATETGTAMETDEGPGQNAPDGETAVSGTAGAGAAKTQYDDLDKLFAADVDDF